MHEIELKFVVPEYKLDAVKRQMQVKNAHYWQLDALYYDTPDKLLGKNLIAIRLRQEIQTLTPATPKNTQATTAATQATWVQTLKAVGDGLSKRIEDNVIIDVPAGTNPATLVPQLSRHRPEIIELLQTVAPLATLQQSLCLQYHTQVERVSRQVKKAGGHVVEIAFDTGKVTNADHSQYFDLCELEFELIAGDINLLFDTAKNWCKRHNLWLSQTSKAELGARLVAGIQFAPATKAKVGKFKLAKKIDTAHFLQAVVHQCLCQIVPNATEIATGSTNGEHVHQLRVGIRRLRTALAAFSHFSTDIQPHWQLVLKQTFNLLGEYRDLDVLQQQTQVALEAEGAPHVEWCTHLKVMPIDAVKAIDFQQVLVALIQFSSKDIPANGQTAKPALRPILNKLFNKIAKDSQRFATLPAEQQHEVRKRLKKLRYICEFAAPLFKQKVAKTKKAKNKQLTNQKINAFIEFLEPAQDLLGDYNDAVVAHKQYLAKTAVDANAWFAVGWFKSREEYIVAECAKALLTIKNAPTFW